MNANPASVRSLWKGRLILLLGNVCPFLGPLLYLWQMQIGRLETPWYAPALAMLGAGLAALALWQRRSWWRILALAFVALFAGFEWWFLLGYTRLPAYTGPVANSRPFPVFSASLANGEPFTQAELEGERDTALLFFRGHW
jgi:hypothetical protein